MFNNINKMLTSAVLNFMIPPSQLSILDIHGYLFYMIIDSLFIKNRCMRQNWPFIPRYTAAGTYQNFDTLFSIYNIHVK